MKFFISKSKKLPPAAQKELLPRKEFMTQGKERFLAAFDASALARDAHLARPAYVAIFFKTSIGVMAALCVGVGLSAYADTANVSATSPLYPLKRLSENVQLAVTPAPQKAQLQATFAVRRANEIAALQASQPSSTLIPALTSDLDQDISSSLAAATSVDVNASVGVGIQVGGGIRSTRVRNGRGAGTAGTSTVVAAATTATISSSTYAPIPGVAGPVNVYCAAFNNNTSGVLFGHLESDLVLRPGALAQFNRECGSDSRVHDGRTINGNSTSSAVTASTTITTTTDTTSSYDIKAGATVRGSIRL